MKVIEFTNGNYWQCLVLNFASSTSIDDQTIVWSFRLVISFLHDSTIAKLSTMSKQSDRKNPFYILMKEIQKEELKLGMHHRIGDDYLERIAEFRWSS